MSSCSGRPGSRQGGSGLPLERGAEVDALAYSTPFDDAVREGHEAMQALLRRYGGRCEQMC